MEIHINEKRSEAEYINNVVEQFCNERRDIAYPKYENDLNMLKLQNRSLWERFNSAISRAGAVSWHSSCSAPFIGVDGVALPKITVPDECNDHLAQLWTRLEEHSLSRECKKCKMQVPQYLEELQKQIDQQVASMSADIEMQMERPASAPKTSAPSTDIWSELKNIQQDIALIYERIEKLLPVSASTKIEQQPKKISFELPNFEPAEPLKTLEVSDSQISSCDLLI